ncbi:LysE family transporter [Actinomadura fulvescens]
MVEIFALALWVGLVFNAAPGAVFSESLRRGMVGGFRPAFAVQVGSLAGDAVWALLGLVGVGALFSVPTLRIPLAIGGCLLLGWLGVTGLRDAVKPHVRAQPRSGDGQRAALAVGAGMSLGNPWNIVYWSGVSGAITAALDTEAGLPGLATFFTGFMIASLVWCFVCAGLITLVRKALPPWAVRVIEGGCGISLLVFAALLAARVVTGGA